MKTVLIRQMVVTASLIFSIGQSRAAAAVAEFSGNWRGLGQVTIADPFTGKKTYPCSEISLDIDQKVTELKVVRYEAKCQMAGSSWGPYTFELRGDKVFEDGEETGTFVDDTFKTLQARGSVQYAFNLRLKDASKSTPSSPDKIVETYYGTRNLMGTIVIEGNLSSK
jgi:hypothetical protein